MKGIKLNEIQSKSLSRDELGKLLGGDARPPGQCCCACASIDKDENGTANCNGGLWSPGCTAINYMACDGNIRVE